MSVTGCEPACDPFTYCTRTVSLVGSEAKCDPTARLPGSRCYPSGREHRAIWGAGLLARTSAPWEGRLNGKDKPKKHDDDIGVIVLPRPGTACDRPRYCENDTSMSSHSHSSRSDESLSSGIHQQHVSGHGISEQPDPFQTPPLSESPLSPSSSTPSISSPAEAVPTGTSSPSIPQSPPRRLRFSELSLSEAVLQGGPTRRGHSRRTLSSHSTVSLRKPYPSTKLRGEHPKPWLKYPDPAQRWARVIFWTLFAVGFAASGAICYFGYASVPQLGKVCLVMDDDFSNGIDTTYWSHEVRLDGYGNHEFEWTTTSANNSFVQDGILYIVPTLTSDSLGSGAITNGYILNLTADGTCTSTNIAEARGNAASYLGGGIDKLQGGIHWGPLPQFDSWWRTFGIQQDRIRGYHADFHKYTLEWDERYLTIYVDNRVYSSLDLSFDRTFWTRGNFPTYYVNGSETVKLSNPWVTSTSNAAPFDQAFYLILDVAVGGTNGFFPDNVGGKPWVDSSLTAMSDFWSAKDLP
ncbi:hypothetical protein EHS25_008915 [Saitozyma podzolica]|uniref:GH16 domain-containing protein n=1 Tax=Saitozyma podzolica TaxID=1890683 RepID=A0A427YN66_9TREE|nr:hypothetical protein EHS25_008915 [Saitozyma podzolica]